jgi:hypothetical protein
MVALALCALLALALNAHADGPKQQGMAYAAYWSGQYGSPESDVALGNLAATGAEWLSLLVSEYQDSVDSTRIYATEATPTRPDLERAIARSQGLGLHIMLKPHVDPLDGNWRGEIGRHFTASQWHSWFASYRAFIVPYAQLAQEHHLEQFCVGVEYVEASKHSAKWRQVVAAVRGVYSGSLVYAANHSGEELQIDWWDALDYVGVDAYYPLTSRADPSLGKLIEAWGAYTPTLASLHETWQRPVLLTEIGYRSVDWAASAPWDWQSDGQVDLGVQARCYEAVFETLWHEPWLEGIYWWAWDYDPWTGGPVDTDYTPFDKPAEDVLRRWYGAGPRREPARPAVAAEGSFVIYDQSLASGWGDRSWGCAWREATLPAPGGERVVAADLEPWGGLAFGAEGLDVSPYYWLTVRLRATAPGARISLVCHDGQDVTLNRVRLNHWRFSPDGQVPVGTWLQADIPLEQLGLAGGTLSRLTIQNWSEQNAGIQVDAIRLSPARWMLRLPLIWRRVD